MSNQYSGIIIICGIFLILGMFSLNQMIIYTPDSARYLVWANSLAKMEGFKDATNPETSRYVVHAPLYPILLIPGALLFPNNIIIAKAITLLLGTATLFIFFLWLRKRVGKNHALLGTLILALNPLMTIFSTQILSDIPFALALILYFIYAEKISSKNMNADWHEYILLLFIIACVFLREVGITLMLSAVLFFLINKQYRRAALFFLIPCFVYMVWFIRNDVIVAAFENPATRNSYYFLNHFYTANQESLLTEFRCRFLTNLSIYTHYFLRLIFMPDYVRNAFSLITLSDTYVSLILRLLPIGQFIIYGATSIFCVVGVWQELKNPKTFSILVIFLVCYSIPILFYPINDIRFLFPLLIVMIFFWIIGLKYVYKLYHSFDNETIKIMCVICFVFCLLIPNTVWLQSYLRNNWNYSQSPEKLYDQIKNEQKYPEQFTKPLYLAGQWIVQHSESSTVVVCRWKELTFSLKGRKLIEVQSQITPDIFDNILRDYEVTYIVAAVSRVGLSELEGVLNRSYNFSFYPVYHVGIIEVLKVERRPIKFTNITTSDVIDTNNRAIFRNALCILENQPAEAEHMLKSLSEKTNGDALATFFYGVAKEFNGELDSASAIFARFGLMSQAGSYVQQALYHLEMIARLKKAANATSSSERAEAYHFAGLNYWNLGYRAQAIKMLKQSLGIDSSDFPTCIFLSIFSLQIKDTISAKKYLNMARILDSINMLVKNMETILNSQDSLKMNLSPAQQIELRIKIVDAYISMGMNEIAIDELLIIIKKNLENTRALKLLAELMESKKHYAPALHWYQVYLTYDSTNSDVKQKVTELSALF